MVSEKKIIRRQINSLLENLTESDRIGYSRTLTEKIRSLPQWKKWDALFAFYPFNRELDILPLLQDSLGKKTIGLPLIQGKSMQFFSVNDLSRSALRVNKWGIPEPGGEEEPLDPRDFSHPLMLVPGLAFTLEGKRLGRGGGFYDRYLQDRMNLTLMGLAYPFQIIDDIPLEAHDVLLDGIFF